MAIPMDQRDGWIWFDGELKPWKDAKIHVLTHGLHYASTVFEASAPMAAKSSNHASTPSG